MAQCWDPGGRQKGARRLPINEKLLLLLRFSLRVRALTVERLLLCYYSRGRRESFEIARRRVRICWLVPVLHDKLTIEKKTM